MLFIKNSHTFSTLALLWALSADGMIMEGKEIQKNLSLNNNRKLKIELSNQSIILQLESEQKQKQDKDNELRNQYKNGYNKRVGIVNQLNECWNKITTTSEEEKRALEGKFNTLEQELREINVTMDKINAEGYELFLQLTSLHSRMQNLYKGEVLLRGLKNGGFLSDSARVERIIQPNSKDASDIIFIKEFKDSCPLIAKVFKRIPDFVQEHKNITAGISYGQLISELRRKCGYNLPVIIDSKGGIIVEGIGVLLLEKAQGKPIAEYINSIDSMDDSKIRTLFTRMGEQFGKMDELMLENFKKILSHSDSHANNFFYDEDHNQVYWIDTAGGEGLRLINKENGLENLLFLTGKSSLNLDNILDYITEIKKYRNEYTIKNNYKIIKKYLKARQSFAQGYYNKNKIDVVKTYYNERYNEIFNQIYILKKDFQYLNNIIEQLSIDLEPLNFDLDYAIQ